MVTTVSPQGAAFTAGNEGFVSHFYKDSGGVGTIGNGFTAMSKVFSDYWMKTRGHKLRSGDTITRDESVKLLNTVMDAEYAPPVARKYGDSLKQNEFDAVADTVYNCGAGTLKDAWAGLLAAGNVAGAAYRILNTRVTAGGRVLSGLYHRRTAESRLLLNGDYGSITASTAAAADPSIADDIAKLGFKDVSAFQAANGLVVDGIAGPATKATLRRALDAKAAKTAAKTVGTGSTAATAATHHVATAHAATSFDIHTLYWAAGAGLTALAVVGLAYLAYRNRGVILRKRTPA